MIDAYHDPYILSDLHKFDQTFGLSDPPTAVIDLAGSTTNDGWALEEALDVEWAHAIAPGAGIMVIEAKSASTSDLLAAVNLARSIPYVSVVSMSWGSSEFSGETSLDSYFTTPAGHTGITFVAASGDDGASAGAEWPAASSKVLSVGGTTLRIASSGVYQSEALWSGSGAGTSRYVSEPSYQSSLQSSGRLSVPDVAFDADPNTGVYVEITTPSTGVSSWYQVGGTSLGAPVWAGIIAIADEARSLSGKGTLDGATQTLPTLFSLPSSDFHKIASVTSGFPFATTITAGLGTPNGAALVNGLAFSTVTSSSAKSVTGSTASSARSASVASAEQHAGATPDLVVSVPLASEPSTVAGATVVALDLSDGDGKPFRWRRRLILPG